MALKFKLPLRGGEVLFEEEEMNEMMGFIRVFI